MALFTGACFLLGHEMHKLTMKYVLPAKEGAVDILQVIMM